MSLKTVVIYSDLKRVPQRGRDTHMPVRKLTALALYTTLSLTVYAVESMIPPLIPIPGIKLGLANRWEGRRVGKEC